MKLLIAFFAVALSLCADEKFTLPPASAPGAVNPDITQANIQTTVCVANFTKTIRPPASYTDKLKIQDMLTFHLKGKLSDYELDHRLDLAAGGAPRDPKNLWMQAWPEARLKDRLETFEHRQMCQGKISLKAVQTIFLGDFWREYVRLAPSQGWPLTAQ